VLPLLPEQVQEIRQDFQPGSTLNTTQSIVAVQYDEWLMLEYMDLIPVQTVQYHIKVAVPGSIETSALQVGGEMTITVRDSDLDWSHDQIDTFAMTATVLLGQSVQVSMLETDVHSGKFTGLVSINSLSISDPFISNVAYLPGVSLGQTVQVTYNQQEPSNQLTANRTVTASTTAVLSTDAVRGNINKRDFISITVVDADLDLSPLLVNTAQVIVSLYTPSSDSRNQHTETVILQEIALDSAGVFTGRLLTKFGSLNAASDNGVMDVGDGDHLVVRYRDAAPAATLEKTVKVSTAGSIIMIPALLDAGQEITVQVSDYDLNVDPVIADVGIASVFSAHGDVEQVTLTETALDSSVFTGALSTSASFSAPEGTLAGVVADSVITATYIDRIVDTSTRTQSYSALARVATNGTLLLLPVLITQDLPVTITVTDKDQNRDTSMVETLPCQLVSICSSETQSWDGSSLCSIDPANEQELDAQNVTLTENSLSSGIFTAVVATHSQNRLNASKAYFEPSVRAPSGALVRLQYLDRNPMPSRLRVTERRVARAGLLYSASSFVNEYSPLLLTLEDADLDLSALRDTNCAPGGMEGADAGELLRNCPAPIKLIGPPGNGTHDIIGYQSDGINMLLYETQVHSGVFTGAVDTTSGVFQTVQSGIIQAATQGSFITLTYTDQVPAALRSRRVKVATVATIITSPTILPAGNNISITVRDNDLNTDETLAETTTVIASQLSLTPHDTRHLLLTETGVDTGLFTATLQTSVDSANAGGSGSNPLYAPAGSFITFTITDSNPIPETTRMQIVGVSTRGVIHMQCPASAAGTWTACSRYDITVTDADLSDTSTAVETRSGHIVGVDQSTRRVYESTRHSGRLSIYNRRGEEREELILTEKGQSNNAFSASLEVVVSNAGDCGGGGSRGDGKCGNSPLCIGTDCCALSNDGKLFISSGDTVQAVYRDASPADYIKITRVVPTVGQCIYIYVNI